MKTLETGQDKIQKICDKIRRETLEPAQIEAQNVIADAKNQSEEIIKEAERHAEQILKQARQQIEQERHVFHSSLQQAAKQAVEALRQEVEHELFNAELEHILAQQFSNPDLIAQLINGIVKALEKEGISADLSVVIPQTVSAQDVAALLLGSVQQRLIERPLELGNFAGGAQVKIQGKGMKIDLSDQALKELLANYTRKDFREYLFSH